MSVPKQSQYSTEVRWAPAFTAVVVFLLVVIGTYWSAAIALVLALGTVAIVGARSISSVERSSDTTPADDRSRATRVLSTSPTMQTAAHSIEWLAWGGGAFVAVAQPPIEAIAMVVPNLWPVAALAVVLAFILVAWERRAARRTLQLKIN